MPFVCLVTLSGGENESFVRALRNGTTTLCLRVPVTRLWKNIHSCTDGKELAAAVSTGLSCTVELDQLSFVPPALSEQVLRIIGEGLTNAVRHAQARQVWVRAVTCEQTLMVEIGDDGIGFDPTSAMAEN